MTDTMTDSARMAAEAVILAKREELLRERAQLQEMRADILARTRRNERALSDCRAAARLFQVDIDFPSDDDDPEREYLRRRAMNDEREMREREMRTRALIAAQAEARRQEERNRISHLHQPDLIQIDPPRPEVTTPPPPQTRPTLRVFLLDALERAGANGGKAAVFRELFERTFGEMIHEKTVGMTLYRLSKEGLVTRDGHNWFFVSRQAADETENPGAGTPGPNSPSS